MLPLSQIDAFFKTAQLDVLTGRMGAGKTTLSKKLKSDYDLVVQTDMPRPMDKRTGKYDEPTRTDKERIRSERREEALSAHRAGKKVLVEGHPPGVVKLLREGLKSVDKVMEIAISREESFKRVAKRALGDPEYDLETDMDAAARNNDLYEHYRKQIAKDCKIVPYHQKTASLAVPEHHQDKLDKHFVSTDPRKWRELRRAIRSKTFVVSLQKDERADKRLKLFAENVGRHLSSKDPGLKVTGEGGTYLVKYHPEEKCYSCSCPHWTYKLSIKGSKGSDCKHISSVKGEKNKEAFNYGAVRKALSVANVARQRESNEDDAWKNRIVDRAYLSTVPRENIPQGPLLEFSPFRVKRIPHYG